MDNKGAVVSGVAGLAGAEVVQARTKGKKHGNDEHGDGYGKPHAFIIGIRG
jgi:hypothetical protein